MDNNLLEIVTIAAQCTESQSDGYSKILRICQAMQSEESVGAPKPINAFSNDESTAEMVTLPIDIDDLDQIAKEHPELTQDRVSCVKMIDQSDFEQLNHSDLVSWSISVDDSDNVILKGVEVESGEFYKHSITSHNVYGMTTSGLLFEIDSKIIYCTKYAVHRFFDEFAWDITFGYEDAEYLLEMFESSFDSLRVKESAVVLAYNGLPFMAIIPDDDMMHYPKVVYGGNFYAMTSPFENRQSAEFVFGDWDELFGAGCKRGDTLSLSMNGKSIIVFDCGKEGIKCEDENVKYVKLNTFDDIEDWLR